MVKIHIIGGPGSGKTTLAQCLSSKFHIPFYDLDHIKWNDALSIAEQSAWITEGIYLIWTEPMLYYADIIVLLEIPWPRAAWRIIFRHLSRSFRGINPYPGIQGIKLLIKLLRDTRSYFLNEEEPDTPKVESVQLFLEQHRDIAEPPTKEFVRLYLQTYAEIAEPPAEEFVRLYLQRYKEKVVVVKNATDRKNLLKRLPT